MITKIFKSLLVMSSLLAFSSTNVFAQEENSDFKVTGNLLLRSEIDARDFKNSTNPFFFTSLRTSIGVEKELFNKVKFYAQLRDSRIMGEETNTLTSMKNVDLHQGYVQIKNIFDVPLSLQLGRFENNFGTQRFIGAVDWNYVARSFDGVKLNYSNKDFFNFSTDLFSFIHNTPAVYIANPTLDKYKESTDQSYEVHGFWSNAKLSPAADISLFGMYKNNKKQTKPTFNDINLATVGLNYSGSYGPISTLVESAYQTGSYQDLSTNAYLVSGQIFGNIGDFKLGLGTDILSGNNPESLKTKNVFAVPFGTNHMFYGFMDYFIDIPANTKNLGLNDFYFTSNWKSDSFPLSIGLNAHHFMPNQTIKTGENTFGQEVDLTLKYPIIDKTNLVLGGSVFNPGNLMKTDNFFGKSSTDLSYWGYAMIMSNF